MKRAARAEAARLLAALRDAGAVEVEADILQPAETLLDLYGEDIRARAYTTADPLRGEMMLRPDFTVPVVRMHMQGGAEPARYCYAGEVFRRQEEDTGRPSEYLQAGFELFAREAPWQADAEVFALIAGLLEGLPVTPVTGDMALLIAAVRGLDTLPSRKAALLRHIWRPRRFRALLERFGAPARARSFTPSDAPLIGLRSEDEIAARLKALHDDAAAPPIAAREIAFLNRLLTLHGPARACLATLRAMEAEHPAIGHATETLARRLDALDALGIATETLAFEASHGRSALEYYDGFVFSFLAENLPPIASGGRYDALTRQLGQGREIPAVGGIIRPGLTARLRGAA